MADLAQQDPDLALGVEFFIHPVEQPAKSREAGRPIYEDREYIRITLPGDRLREHVAPADEMHYVSHMKRQMTYADRFARVYQAWKDTGAEIGSGTPLSAAPFMTPARIEELKHRKIRTVEQLAGLPDSVARTLGMGTRDLIAQANAYLKAAGDTSEITRMQAEIDALKRMIGQPALTAPDPFEGMERDDLHNMAVDAGLEPRANASREALVKMLTDAANKKAA